jgi:hypothetical protein
MKKFEIHITGTNESIIEEFKTLGYKTLEVLLMDPAGQTRGKENMCCIQKEFETYEKCLEFTLSLVATLKSEIARVKIESCYYEEYLEKAIYAEVHTSPIIPGQPWVSNFNKKKYTSTERTYNPDEFLTLKSSIKNKNSEFELCLYDSNPNFDDYWLSFYDL